MVASVSVSDNVIVVVSDSVLVIDIDVVTVNVVCSDNGVAVVIDIVY